eukprot:Opistho-2@46319
MQTTKKKKKHSNTNRLHHAHTHAHRTHHAFTHAPGATDTQAFARWATDLFHALANSRSVKSGTSILSTRVPSAASALKSTALNKRALSGRLPPAAISPSPSSARLVSAAGKDADAATPSFSRIALWASVFAAVAAIIFGLALLLAEDDEVPLPRPRRGPKH